MALALNIRSDDQSSIQVEKLWKEFSVLEELPSMANLGYRPHITFAIYDDLELNVLQSVFDEVFKSVYKTTILFDGLNAFESADSLVIWAKPILPKEIKAIHSRIHELIDVNSCREHYRPANWIPHCSVATMVPIDRKGDAVKLMQQKIEPFDVTFDVADVVSFLPVQIKQEITLIEPAA